MYFETIDGMATQVRKDDETHSMMRYGNIQPPPAFTLDQNAELE